jgi:hypothetical protein
MKLRMLASRCTEAAVPKGPRKLPALCGLSIGYRFLKSLEVLLLQRSELNLCSFGSYEFSFDWNVVGYFFMIFLIHAMIC